MNETTDTIALTFISQIIVYIILFAISVAIVYGLRLVYIGIKKKQKWAIIIAIVVAIVFILAVIGGIGFYLYAVALGEAFKTGL